MTIAVALSLRTECLAIGPSVVTLTPAPLGSAPAAAPLAAALAASALPVPPAATPTRTAPALTLLGGVAALSPDDAAGSLGDAVAQGRAGFDRAAAGASESGAAPAAAPKVETLEHFYPMRVEATPRGAVLHGTNPMNRFKRYAVRLDIGGELLLKTRIAQVRGGDEVSPEQPMSAYQLGHVKRALIREARDGLASGSHFRALQEGIAVRLAALWAARDRADGRLLHEGQIKVDFAYYYEDWSLARGAGRLDRMRRFVEGLGLKLIGFNRAAAIVRVPAGQEHLVAERLAYQQPRAVDGARADYKDRFYSFRPAEIAGRAGGAIRLSGSIPGFAVTVRSSRGKPATVRLRRHEEEDFSGPQQPLTPAEAEGLAAAIADKTSGGRDSLLYRELAARLKP